MKKLNIYFAWIFSVIFTISAVGLPLMVELTPSNCAMIAVSMLSCGAVAAYFWLKIIIVELHA